MDDERDACALVAIARKDGAATREILAETIRGLECLAHRSGSIDGEGDGSGVLTDIPRGLWADALAASRLDPSLARDARFAVAVYATVLPSTSASSAMPFPDTTVTRRNDRFGPPAQSSLRIGCARTGTPRQGGTPCPHLGTR